jgi:lipopolysaccharide/colanic/teichoic acid biosynthesis glycosyltransferase
VLTLPIQIKTHPPEPEARPVKAEVRPGPGRPRRIPEAFSQWEPQWTWYHGVKAALDVTMALVLALVTSPVIVIAAALVKLTSRGPAFYTQVRVGRNGRQFTIYKIRTMIHNCESLTGPRWSMPGDPRVTLVGRFLRATHLDELPQLLNVLRGDMSLIGPRPERPEFLPELRQALPTYSERLRVRPGVTGLAQVQLPADTDLDSVRRKLAYDLYYIQNTGPWLDLRLLASTAFYAVGVSYAVLRRVFRLPDFEQVERQTRSLVPGIVTRQRLSA